MINGREKLAHIQRQYKIKAAQEFCTTIQGAVGAFAYSVGIGIKNKIVLKERCDYIARGMMHHAITKGAAEIYHRLAPCI